MEYLFLKFVMLVMSFAYGMGFAMLQICIIQIIVLLSVSEIKKILSITKYCKIKTIYMRLVSEIT